MYGYINIFIEMCRGEFGRGRSVFFGQGQEEKKERGLSKDRRKTFIKKGKLDFARGSSPCLGGGVEEEEERGLRKDRRKPFIKKGNLDFARGSPPASHPHPRPNEPARNI